MTGQATLNTVIKALRSAGDLDRAAVEHATGATLAATSENAAFAMFEGHDVKLDDVTLGFIDLRHPKPGETATGGALLNLRITHGCPKRAAIEAKYGPFQITGVPRGRSLDEETSLSREEPWGRLSFGFAERTPDCLTTVTFARKSKGP